MMWRPKNSIRFKSQISFSFESWGGGGDYDYVDISSAWGSIRQSMKASARGRERVVGITNWNSVKYGLLNTAQN
jgi:hypothetical protein